MCLQIVLPNFLLQDILRLPVLVVHYFHHNQSDRHTHFTDFIAQHYSHDQHHDEDHSEHSNLPFHHHDLNLQLTTYTIAITDIYINSLPCYDILDTKNKITARQHFYSSATIASIWRPPKFA